MIQEWLHLWKRFYEQNLKVNMLKPKLLVCGKGLNSLTDPGKYPCGVYCKSVGVNSIYCGCYHHWVHKRCAKLSGSLTAAADFMNGPHFLMKDRQD